MLYTLAHILSNVTVQMSISLLFNYTYTCN